MFAMYLFALLLVASGPLAEGAKDAYGECEPASKSNCLGMANGNYRLCYPACTKGDYISCSNGIRYIMPCPLAFYGNPQFTAKMVFDPQKKACKFSSPSCPRRFRRRKMRYPME